MEIYARSHSKELISKNIQSGCRKARLIQFNPAAVLRQLSTKLLILPPPCIPTEFLIPKNAQHLEVSIERRDKLAATGKTEDLKASRKI